ncbi:MAG: DUF362 domain-containing protein [candidate division Zixibacteria bacterium]
MSKKINRRSFIKKSTAIGAATAIGGATFSQLIDGAINQARADEKSDICSIIGKNYFDNTLTAIEQIGGIGQFVTEGAKVGLLVNAVRGHPGTDVHPDVLLAVLFLCHQAGAGELKLLKDLSDNYWSNSSRAKEHDKIISSLKIADNFIKVENPKGISLKEVHVQKDLLECDAFINISLAKNHIGTMHTGVLKNFMGACPHNPTNRFCHFGSDTETEEWYANCEFLSQCIADMNLVRKPDLCVNDSIEFLTTNGPFGPGEIGRKDAITVGTDPVAVDAYSVRYLGLKPKDVIMIGMAADHGIGTDDLKSLNIKEITA